jgi:hypothetical protein
MMDSSATGVGGRNILKLGKIFGKLRRPAAVPQSWGIAERLVAITEPIASVCLIDQARSYSCVDVRPEL